MVFATVGPGERILREAFGFLRTGNPTLNFIGSVMLWVILAILVFAMLWAVLQRRRRAERIRQFRSPVTVLTIGAEFARPLRKRSDGIEVAVMKTVTCRAENGETVQVDLPAAHWGTMPRGSKGVLVAKGREFVSYTAN